MRTRPIGWTGRTVVAALLATGGALAAASSASAATSIGDNCTATAAPPAETYVLRSSAGPFNATPATDGVVTKWTMTNPLSAAIPMKLKVLTPGPGANDFKVDAESATENLPPVSNANVFATRLPIQAGDRIGLYGSTATFICQGQPAATVSAGLAGDSPVGTTGTYTIQSTVGLPVVATVEPDADGDGFGDESQDLCPASAATQATCPTVELKMFTVPGRGSLSLLVTSNLGAAVTVAGTAKIAKSKGGKGKRAKQTVNLNGGTQTVAPGDLAIFKVKYPKALTKALKALPASRSIKLNLNASAPNLVGDPTLATTTAKAAGTG